MVQPASLTPKQQRFVDAYLIDGNATDAYQAAYGCSRATADANGSRALGTARIAAHIAARRAKVAARVDLTLQAHLQTLEDLRNKAASAEQYSASVTAEVSRGKASGFYIDKHEHKHAGAIQVRVRIEREGRRTTAG